MDRTAERFSIFTTGCKANQWDSHVIAERLKSAGLTQGTVENSDIIVVNACSLTARAEADARRFIAKARRLNGLARIALVGCHAQAYQERDFGADLVLGQEEKFDAEQYLGDHGRFVAKKRSFSMERPPADWVRKDRTRCFFKIQDGCNKFCTYCVVPYARGAIRSRPASDIAAFMEVLAGRGTKEVVLTGIDLAAYSDPESGRGLTELLQLLETLDTPGRIRLSSDRSRIPRRQVRRSPRSIAQDRQEHPHTRSERLRRNPRGHGEAVRQGPGHESRGPPACEGGGHRHRHGYHGRLSRGR